MEEIYLQLLRKAVLNQETNLDRENRNEKTLDQVWRLAQCQGTAALVGNELLKEAAASSLKVESESGGEAEGRRGGEAEGRKGAIQMMCMQAMVGQERQMRALKKVWNALENAGLEPVLLKGFGLAQLYPLPYLRQWGDADIWVGKGHYEEVTEAICKTMNVTWHHESENENERHYNFNTEDGFVFEIHPQTIPWILPKEEALYQKLEQEAMARCETIEIDGQTFRVPERGFNQLFVFLHAWEHFISSGTNMKQLSDLALLCQREPLPQRFYEALRPLGMLEPWEVMGYVVVKLFNLKPECWTGYSNSRRIARLGERAVREIMGPLSLKGRFAERPGKALKDRFAEGQSKWLRKLGTLMERVKKAREIGKVSPKYGRHYLWMAVYKGMRRLNAMKGY